MIHSGKTCAKYLNIFDWRKLIFAKPIFRLCENKSKLNQLKVTHVRTTTKKIANKLSKNPSSFLLKIDLILFSSAIDQTLNKSISYVCFKIIKITEQSYVIAMSIKLLKCVIIYDLAKLNKKPGRFNTTHNEKHFSLHVPAKNMSI